MDIERINENTLKLFITYNDIEDRGYSREEIWYNRSKGEELFWDLIGEVNTDDYFDLEGPIWIHINASDSGLEVVVTRANLLNDSDTSSMAGNFDDTQQLSDHLNNVEEAFYNTFAKDGHSDSFAEEARFRFKDIDELLPLANKSFTNEVKTSLYKLDDYFYLTIDLKLIEDKEKRKNIVAICKEYIQPSKLTIHRLQEYGELIIDDNALETISMYF